MAYQLNPHMIIHIFDDNEEAIEIVVKAFCSVSYPELTFSEIQDSVLWKYKLQAKELLRDLVLSAITEKVE